ncbi:MAG: hypothetical protein IPK83_24345 [Planctomycetes bacterium]|nr:hypothetical protein [Planctomycetota bacterium]
MSTFPTGKRSEFLQWCQAHVPVWEANAGDIGLTDPQAGAFGIRIVKMAAAELALDEAKQAYEAAVQTAKAAFRLAKSDAAILTQAIRAKALSTKNPLTVYNLAQIAPPRKRRPAPPPARPTRLDAALGASDGSLTLTWKCTNPAGTSGTSYVIRRRLAGDTGYTVLGMAGKKRFVDEMLPTGSSSVQYTIQGIRAGIAGPQSDILTVSLGARQASPPVATVRMPVATMQKAAAAFQGAGRMEHVECRM